jgi:hypothetical protein
MYFKKAYDSVRREVLYSIFIEFGISRKLVGLIKMCLNETFSTVQIGKNLTCFLWPESRRRFVSIAFQLRFGIRR